MKILHISDIHINTNFDGGKYPQINEAYYRRNFEWINTVASIGCDVIAIAGDLFASPFPTPDDYCMACRFISGFINPVIITRGNHETSIHSASSALGPLTFINDEDKIIKIAIDRGGNYLGIQVVPWGLNPIITANSDFKAIVWHVPVKELTPGDRYCIGRSYFNLYKDVFYLLGHYHAFTRVSDNAIYVGSPFATSFRDEGIDKGVGIFDTETWNYNFIKNPNSIPFSTISVEEVVNYNSNFNTITRIRCNIKQYKELSKKYNCVLDVNLDQDKSGIKLLNFNEDSLLKDYFKDKWEKIEPLHKEIKLNI